MTHPTYQHVTDEQQGGLFDEDTLETKWRVFHEANPVVYRVFEKLTLEAIAADVKVGAKQVWEQMRWHFKLHPLPTDGAHKLNNNLTAFYARHFHACHPRHEGYFQTRGTRS